jgi:SAM-dependent methyltransferase
LREGDIVAGPVEPGSFDLVTARAVFHHVADAEAAIKNLVASVRPGGAQWANYWTQTITELRNDLTSSGKLNDALVDTFLSYCADSNWWTQTIAFTVVHGRAPEA